MRHPAARGDVVNAADGLHESDVPRVSGRPSKAKGPKAGGGKPAPAKASGTTSGAATPGPAVPASDAVRQLEGVIRRCGGITAVRQLLDVLERIGTR
jgi:hypothetical protein